MENLSLHTVSIFKKTNKKSNGQSLEDGRKLDLFADFDVIAEHPNMTSARVIKGRMIEMEHTKLVGPTVKFKTVINFDRALSPETSLGVVLTPQDGYIVKPDLDET